MRWFLSAAARRACCSPSRADRIRPTLDVDLVVEVTTSHDFHAFEARLRKRGFTNDMTANAPICRYVCEAVTVDVMPSNATALGFGNRWYPLAVRTAQSFALSDDCVIRLIHAPVFIATKLEAFKDRGGGDYLLSHDLEDITAVLDGRPELIEEITRADADLRQYLAAEFSTLLTRAAYVEALPGHLPADRASQARLPQLLKTVETIRSHSVF